MMPQLKKNEQINYQNGEKSCWIQQNTAPRMRGGIAGVVKEKDAPGTAARRGSPL